MQIDFSDEQSRKAHDSMRFDREFESKIPVWRELGDWKPNNSMISIETGIEIDEFEIAYHPPRMLRRRERCKNQSNQNRWFQQMRERRSIWVRNNRKMGASF
jgi:hypothetical protein